MTQGWAEMLFTIYRLCRGEVKWLDVYNLHDKEDQGYFDMLDETRE